MTRSKIKPSRSGRASGVLAATLLGGCYSGADDGKASGSAAEDGDSGGSDGTTGGAPLDACGGGVPEVGPTALHRLTPLQYTNSIRALFDDPDFEASYTDEQVIPTLLGVRQLRTDAELVLGRSDQWGADIWGCDVGGAADDGCAQQFIETFGARVFRRPLDETERQWFTDLYTDAKAEFSFADAMGIVLASMIQAPEFLYLPEFGEAVDGLPANVRRLTGYEIASRLSYLLWDTMPDDALLAAAAAGELVGREGLRAQAQRMLEDPRAERMVQDFTWEWMQLDGGQLHHALEETDKDPTIFPEYGPSLQEAMRTEFEAFVHETYFGEGGGSFDALMTSNRAYVNASLAALYGVSGPADDDTWAWVDLDPSQRSGMLTRAAFLTVFSTARVQAPIRRGVLVVREVLCSELGNPPPDVDNSPVEPGQGGEPGTTTVRQEVEARTTDGQCQTCHSVVNPAGFAFEHYDALGRWQDNELGSGLPIDSSGALLSSDVDGPVADALELSAKLAQSERVRECFAGRWLHRATGTTADDASECDRTETLTAFRETGDMRELLLDIVLSDSFRFINTAQE